MATDTDTSTRSGDSNSNSNEIPEAMLNRMRYYAEIVARDTTEDGERRMFAHRLARLQEKYSIQEWELYQTAEAKVTPGVRKNIFIAPSGHLLSWELATLATSTSHLFNVKVHFNGFLSSKTHLDGYNLEATAMGFETDLLMWEAIFTKIHLHMFSTLVPQIDSELTFSENVYRFHRAGFTWPQMADLFNAFLESNSAPEGKGWPATLDARDGKLKRAAQKEYKANDEIYVARKSPEAYRKSFAMGYVNRIAERLKKAQDETRSTGTDLVLASKYDLVKAAHKETFGETTPGKDASAKKMDLNGYMDGIVAADKMDLPTNNNTNPPAKGNSEINS